MRALFEAMTDVIVVFDSEGRYLKVAPTRPANIYVAAVDRIGKTVHEVFPRATADLVLDCIRATLAENQMKKLEYSLPIDGREIWFEASVSPLSADTTLWIARDVTERKQLERQLRQAQKLEAIGTFVGGIAHDFNNILAAIIGYSELAQKEVAEDARAHRHLGQVLEASARAKDLVQQMLTFGRQEGNEPEALQLSPITHESDKGTNL